MTGEKKCGCGHRENDHSFLGPALKREYGDERWCDRCGCRKFKAAK